MISKTKHLTGVILTFLPHRNISWPVLDEKLNFDERIQPKISKCNKLIGISKILSVMFPGDALLTIKNLSLPNLDYA